jgi:hypothetical protein
MLQITSNVEISTLAELARSEGFSFGLSKLVRPDHAKARLSADAFGAASKAFDCKELVVSQVGECCLSPVTNL